MIPEVVVINAANNNNNDEIEAGIENPLYVPKAQTFINTKISKIRYIEFKKRKRLMNIIKELKYENRQLLRKLRKEKNDDKTDNNRCYKKPKINKNKKGDKNNKEDNKINLLVKLISISNLVVKVRAFYEEDANSTVAAGKKLYITKLKVQKQKRYMTSSRKELHKKFMSKYDVKVSYTFFRKHEPFWVLKPNSHRDTSLCILHENINLKIQVLKIASIINDANSDTLMSNLCCSIYDLNCLKHECQSCKNRTFKVNEFKNDQDLKYYKWVRARESIKTRKGQKVITITKKEEVIAKPREVVNSLLISLPDLFEHCYKIHN